MKILLRFAFIILISSFSSCEIGPQAIEYGNDQCASCKMMISDARFGAELVTLKGRIYKYDAIECMVEHVVKTEEEFAYYMVTDFTDPGKLIDAKTASFLISENRPSPMGAFLSAYQSKAPLNEFQDAKDLKFNWAALVKHFKELY